MLLLVAFIILSEAAQSTSVSHGNQAHQPDLQKIIKAFGHRQPRNSNPQWACTWWQKWFSTLQMNDAGTAFATCATTKVSNDLYFFYGFSTLETPQGGNVVRTCASPIPKGATILVPFFNSIWGGCSCTGDASPCVESGSAPYTLLSGSWCSFEENLAGLVASQNNWVSRFLAGNATVSVSLDDKVLRPDLLIDPQQCDLSAFGDAFYDSVGNAAAGGQYVTINTNALSIGAHTLHYHLDLNPAYNFKFDIIYNFEIGARATRTVKRK